MTGTFLARGLIVGLVAGLLAFTFAKVFGEPPVDSAIAFESHMDEMKREAAKAAKQMAEKAQSPASATMQPGQPGMQTGQMSHMQMGSSTSAAAPAAADEDDDPPELFSRAIQSSIGLFTGIMVYSTAFGGLFSLVFAFAHGRVGKLGPRGLAGLLALAGYIAIVVVPDLKYPANPPSVGNPDTITYRTEMFFLMILISIAAMVFAIQTGRNLIARRGVWNGALLAVALFVVIIGVVQILLPDINEVPDGFPAVVLWRFRIAALGIQAVMWTTLGLGFGWAAERLINPRSKLSYAAG